MLANYAKRTLSFLLALVMVFSVVPVQAFATETESHDHDHEEEIVAESLAAEVDLDTQSVTETETVATTETVAETEAAVETEAVVETEATVETEAVETEAVETEPVVETEPEETVVEDEIVVDPAQEAATLYDQIVAEAKRILEYYLGSADMTEEAIWAATAQFDSGMNLEARYEISLLVEQAAALTDAEKDALIAEATIIALSDFSGALDAYAEPMSTYAGPVYATTADVTFTSSMGSGTLDGGNVVLTFSATAGFVPAGVTKTNTVTITNISSSKAVVTFDYVTTGCSDISMGAASGSYKVTLDANGTAQFTLSVHAAAMDTAEASITISNVQLTEVVEEGYIWIEYDDTMGSVSVDDTVVESYTEHAVTAEGVTLAATANGSEFLGWIDDQNKILSLENPYVYVPTTTDLAFVQPVFADSDDFYFRVGQEYLFDSLDAAIAAAPGSASKTIIPAQSGTLTGSYTIPAGVTLLIPFDETDTAYTTVPAAVAAGFTTPTAYRTLTLATGASLTINGDMNISAKHIAGTGAVNAGTPYLSYGHVKMESGSSMTINSGSTLYAYGYITGSGTVTAESGATVYEYFQVADFRGGTATMNMADGPSVNGVFPLSQYYVQNIEVPLTLKSGATEYGYTSFSMMGGIFGAAVAFIGESGAMFNLTSGYVTKWYDTSADRLVIEVNGDFSISPLKLGMELGAQTIDVNSQDYELPINSNITVQLNSGNAIIAQDIALLPGAKIIIGKDATCTLGSGNNVYVYDYAQWGGYVGSYNSQMAALTFAPGRTGTRAALTDAEIVVKGTLDATPGALYTTTDGASITGEAGGIVKITAGSETATYQATQGADGTITPVAISITSAKLKNADGSYKTTDNAAGIEYTHNNGVWSVKCDAHAGGTANCASGAICIVCGTEYTAKDSSNHTGETEIRNAEDATCSEAGYTGDTYCKGCDAKLASGTATNPTGNHTGGTATCVAQAKCEHCGQSYGEMNASNHTGETEIRDAKAATCGEAGYTGNTYCKGCDAKLAEGDSIEATGEHTVGTAATCKTQAVCKDCGQYFGGLTADNHEGGTRVDGYAAPTCGAAGKTGNTICLGCEKTIKASETIEATGEHTGGTATCTTKASCAVCGQPYGEVDLTNHTGEETEIRNAAAATCGKVGYTGDTYCKGCSTKLEDGKEIAATGNHTGGTATCTKQKECSVCGTAYGDLADHVYGTEWISNKDNHWHKCNNCSAVTEVTAHVPGDEATETEPQVCTVCNYVIEKATGHINHSYTVLRSNETHHWYQCVGCELTTDEVEHTGGEATCTAKAKCEICDTTYGEKDADNHTGGEWTSQKTNATCVKDGKEADVYCSSCNNIKVAGAVIPATGEHTGGTATCIKQATCTVCYNTYGTVDANNHVGGTYIKDAVAATCGDPGYTGDTYCKSCNVKLESGEATDPTGNHTGGMASCIEKAICTVCQTSYGEINLNKHTSDTEVINKKAATCGEDGYSGDVYCLGCKNKIETGTTIAATGKHTGGTASCTVKAECEVCDQEYGELADHIGGTASCTAKAVCEVCDQEYGELKAHEFGTKWLSDETGHWNKCANCDAIDAKAGHTPGEAATCTKEQTCTTCGYVIAEKVAHVYETTWTSNKVGHWHKCKSCDAIDEIVEHTIVNDEKVEATCTESGMTAGSHCEVCELVLIAQEVVEALDHDIVKHEAKVPTYISDGHEAYEECSRCDYTTEVKLPMLEKPILDTYEEFLENLVVLEELAAAYVEENPGKDPLALVIKYIRTGVDRYNSGSWGIMAGYEDTGFAEFVQNYEITSNDQAASVEDLICVTILKDIEYFTLPNGDLVDFGHMFGTMDISYTKASNANVGGWAGDLVDLMSTADRHGVTGTLDEMIKVISDEYLCTTDLDESDIFSQKDMYGDLDAYYIMQQLNSQEYENGLLSGIMQNYFTASLSDVTRADYFLKNKLGGVSTKSAVRDAVFNAYISDAAVTSLEATREFNTADLTDLRRASCYSFADYLCKLAGDYVESSENTYVSVFQSDYSTLAPGITQQISKAYSADDKQMVFYIATADLTRDDVHVYANYNNNDPAAGWAMSRVRDQANAAQEKYGNPESEYYIENYNVIAAINGAGYNMETGEPGGLLVMGGVEYHAPNANGFFGILKDGTAFIGTTDEYYAMKDQVMEGVAGFGSTLVKNGKISISASSNYYTSRASRTAVGITRTGKVVFMVLDGRQEPVSCGGSMEEIAQIMLDAGCVDAINLDGGGSTTYVAKQEGDDELSLINSPSDGYERSVATSLMIVSTAPSSTAFDHALLEAEADYLTVGSSVQLTAAGVSATGNPAALPEGTSWAVSDSTYATITQDGTFTALKNGDVQVSLMLDGHAIGTKTMHIVLPDRIYFSKDSINAVYGETVELPIVALYNGKTVAIRENDVTFTLDNETAGEIDGFSFVGSENSGIKNVRITAALAENNAVTAAISVALFKQGEASFDFDQAVGGDQQLAWDRQVSNSITEDQYTYRVVDSEQDMVTSYIFAIDMTQIPIPEQLEELTYMLPGADLEGASAWTFLMQLAERISVKTEVKPVIQIDPNFNVDVSNVKLVNDYFTLSGVELDEETNVLTLTLNWIDQTMAIDPAMANPICILSGIKLTPKSDAAWDAKDRLYPVNSGEISYTVYLRTSALYTFCQKPENQEKYGLLPFENTDIIINGETEKGGKFGAVYKEFEDSYVLINSLKNGWISENGGYAYYVDGERYTGVQEVDGYYYDFGEDGICIGQTKYTGLFQKDGKTCYAKFGVLSTGWVTVEDERYYFDENGIGCDGKVIVDEVEYEFDNGLMIGGYTGFVKKSNGYTYYYNNGEKSYGWHQIDGYWYFFERQNQTIDGEMMVGTGVSPNWEKALGIKYDFAEDGKLLRGYFNNNGHFYWAGEPLCNAWVKPGSDPNNWYRTNEGSHFVTDSSSNPTIVYVVDGIQYTFDNTNGKLLQGSFVRENGLLYYYWAGEPRNDGWFEQDGNVYYAYEDGHLATGSNNIAGITYLFDQNGVLISNETLISASVSDDYNEMTIKLINTEEDLSKVWFAVWPMGSNKEETAKWVEANKSAGLIWTAEMPLCDFDSADDFVIRAYRSQNDTDEPIAGTRIAVAVPAEHTYTNSADTTCNVCGAERTIITEVKTVPMYRMFNPSSGEHFYTAHASERDGLINAHWNYEGIGWYAPVKSDTPVYRVFNPNTGDHHYTTHRSEMIELVEGGWKYEGIGWYSASEKDTPLYRLWNPKAYIGSHHYTISITERNEMKANGWVDEGIGWYGYRVSQNEDQTDKEASISAAVSADYQEMTIQLLNAAESISTVWFAMSGGEEETVKWIAAEKTADQTWKAEVSLCEFGGALDFTIHAYRSQSNAGESIAKATIVVTVAAEHTYTDDTDTTCNVCGAVRTIDSEGATVKSIPMYRLFNPYTGEHFYTGDKEERDGLIKAGWNDEDIGWYAPEKSDVPVYRVLNPTTGDHHYTTHWSEVTELTKGVWVYEGIGWYSASKNDVPLYRLWNPKAYVGSHHYTVSARERDDMKAAGWVDEGIGWYGLKK